MFDLKIWLIKFVKKLSLVLLSTGLLYTAEELELVVFPPEYAFWAGLLMMVLSQTGNYIKHEHLTK